MLTQNQIHYRRNVLIAIIITEMLMISAFIFFPKVPVPDVKIIYDEPLISFRDIPSTIQNLPGQNSKPAVPPVYIPDRIEAFEPLEDVSFSEASGQDDNISSESSVGNNNQIVNSAPRLIFDVVPAVGDKELKGKLQLSLKIDKNGQVIAHRILFNSLDCTGCLNDLIQAAYKSKWEPTMVNGKNTDYWVVKSYQFN